MKKKAMPPKKEVVMNDWIMDDQKRAHFWAHAKSTLGLTEEEARAALGVTSTKEFAGTFEAALSLLDALASMKHAEEFGAAMGQMPEAPVLAWTQFQKGPGKPMWTISVRAGLPPKLADYAMRETLRQVSKLEGWLETNEYHPVYDGRSTMGTVQKVSQPTTKAASTPPSPSSGPPSPPTTSQQPSDNGRQQEQIEFIKITAPSGKPRIEFWRPNRKYPELNFALGGEAFLRLDGGDNLAAAGWTAEHFDHIGAQYELPLTVWWEQSPKNPKWKDVVAVALR